MGIATRESALAIGFCFPILGGIFVALRFYTRYYQKADRQVDDWLCLPAWVCVNSAEVELILTLQQLCMTGCCVSLLTGGSLFQTLLVGTNVPNRNLQGCFRRPAFSRS